MIKYLIIPLSDNAVSFCHYNTRKGSSVSIEAETLRKALIWSMKENLSVQFLYPSEGVEKEIELIINTIDHTDIVPADCSDKNRLKDADIVVFNTWAGIETFGFRPDQTYIIRTSTENLISHREEILVLLKKVNRMNVVFTDVPDFTPDRYNGYKAFLESLIPTIVEEYSSGHMVQLNLLTDRIMLTGMNNCNAGNESLTLAPDGNLYVCPAFFFDGHSAVGTTEQCPDIKNPQLYRLSHAPICRNCDAYQCKRCVWLNQQLTSEVNTPSKQQCVMAHIERNASRQLLDALRKAVPGFMAETIIREIKYLDPFDNIKL